MYTLAVQTMLFLELIVRICNRLLLEEKILQKVLFSSEDDEIPCESEVDQQPEQK